MPRRSRGHVYRKHPPSGQQPPSAKPPVEAVASGEEVSGVQELVAAPPQPAPYVRTRPVEVAAGASAARASRGLITDYGYVVDELKRIGLTFGGLIALLIVISRLLK